GFQQCSSIAPEGGRLLHTEQFLLNQSFRLLRCGLSCKTTFSKELWTSKPPLYWINPSLRNLFMKVLTRDLVVPTISASVTWLIFAMTGSGFPSLPKFAIRSSNLARRFSLELKSWSTRSSSTRAFL